MGIFRGNKNKNRVSVLRDYTDNQAVLQQIISKLEGMANYRWLVYIYISYFSEPYD